MPPFFSPGIAISSRIIEKGGVIAYPTEGVWGLGCDPFNRTAVEKILALKSRSMNKGLILVAADIHHFDFILSGITGEKRQQLEASWPGPNTWIVAHHHRVPYWVTGDHPGVALRVSDHPLVRALCHHYGGAIVSTSANPQGKPAPIHRWQVCRYFQYQSQLDYIIKGKVGSYNKASTIRDLISGKLIRQ